MTSVPESNEVAGHKYRQAQARTLQRFCRERGLDWQTASDEDLAPILDETGKIIPAPSDLAAEA